MGRMYGKNTLPFTRDNEERKTNSRPPLTWSEPSLAIVVYCRERHVDGFDVRWIYITITTVLVAVIRFSRLSPTTVSLFFSFLRVLSFVLFFSFNPLSRLFSLPFFLSFSSFSFPLTSPKVLHVRVYVRSLFFFLLFFWRVRRRSSTDWNRIVKAAQLSE